MERCEARLANPARLAEVQKCRVNIMCIDVAIGVEGARNRQVDPVPAEAAATTNQES
jgi:hypothetical protein